MEEKQIGVVTHYYNNLGVAIFKLTEGSLTVGDRIRIRGGQVTDFTQEVTSMQEEHRPITIATRGKEFGLKVDQEVREGYKLYKAT